MPTANLEMPYLTANPSTPEVEENEAKDIVDVAIAGKLAIAMADANYTLSAIVLSTTFEWQYNTLIVSPVNNTAIRYIIIPTGVLMKYIVYNNSGSQSVRIIQNAGLSVTVLDTENAYVYCDGNDVYKIS